MKLRPLATTGQPSPAHQSAPQDQAVTTRRLGRQLVPANFAAPWGLLLRLLRTRDPAALFAIESTVVAALLAPLDVALARHERRLYERAAAPQRPIILVTGAPRSGTTLLSQALTAQLPVTDFNN